MKRAIVATVLLILTFCTTSGPLPPAPPAPEISETFDNGDTPLSQTAPPQLLSTDTLLGDMLNVPIIDLGPLTSDERLRLNAQDVEGDVQKIGVSRTVSVRPSLAVDRSFRAAGDPLRQHGAFGDALGKESSWTIGIRSPGAAAIRVHLANVTVVAGASIFVTNRRDEVFGPYDPAVYGDEFWTNTVTGDTALVQVQLPAGRSVGDVVVDRVAHITSEEFASELATDARPMAAPFKERNCPERCLVNESCLSSTERTRIERATRAVAKIAYEKNGGHFICSGGLLRDKSNSGTPYFLTAAHCFNTKASAKSMEAFWQFQRSTCDVRPRTRGRTNGAELLATTNQRTDATFVRLLQQPPTDSYFMSWTNRPVYTSSGVVLNRVHHPHGCSQYFSRHKIFKPRRTNCSITVRPWGQYIYTSATVGCTQKGSSGSLVWNDNFQVVGQLFGGCGGTVDGALSQTYRDISQWLER